MNMSDNEIRGEIMSNTYRDTVVNNLSRLPETITWQNNVTRLNQTNMNTIGSAINVFTQTFTDLGAGVTNGFNNVDLDIKELNDWKEEQLNTGALHDYITFRNTYQEALEKLTGVYKETGITYGGNDAFSINSQISALNLQGNSINITGGSTFNSGATFKEQTNFNKDIDVTGTSTLNGDVNVKSQLMVEGRTLLKDIEGSGTLKITGKSTLSDVAATSLTFGVLVDKNNNTIESFDDLQAKINIYTEPYDITESEEYLSSEEIPAVKFVQSALDEYKDYILEQVPDIEGGGISEERVLELIKENEENDAAAIVYLDTERNIAPNIELQDVYPIQSNDTVLKIVSRNMIQYNKTLPFPEIYGIKFTTNNGKYLTVSGTATNAAETTNLLSVIKASEMPGKYTLKVDNDGVDSSNKKCYISYLLYDADHNIVKDYTKITTQPVVIDTEELGCTDIYIQAHLQCVSGTTFGTQNFRIQVNYGDEALGYTDPVTNESYANKVIHIYGRNLFDATSGVGDNVSFTSVRTDVPVEISGVQIPAIGTRIGTHYIKGVMNKDNYVEYIEENLNTKNLYTPLLKGEKFTLIYNITNITNNVATINNVQIVCGHTDFEKYNTAFRETVLSDANGNCDVSKLNWPYSFVSLEQLSEEEKMFSVYLQYDPALSRDWTEKQLSDLNKRIDTLESIIKSLTN